MLYFIHLATCFSHAQAEAKQVKRWRRCRRSWEIISLHLFRSVRMPELEGYSAKHAPGSQNCLQVMFLQLARIGRNRWDGQRSCRDWRWWAFVFAGKNALQHLSNLCSDLSWAARHFCLGRELFWTFMPCHSCEWDAHGAACGACHHRKHLPSGSTSARGMFSSEILWPRTSAFTVPVGVTTGQS